MEKTKRSGAVAVKIGMSRIFDDSGNSIPVTLVKLDDNVVVGHKTQEKNHYNAVVIGYALKEFRKINKSISGIASKGGGKYEEKAISKTSEFRVDSASMLEIGTKIEVNHFSIGQLIDIRGKTIGKGFAGVMKRHNFGGGEASHGTSISHRSHGATGQRQDPGKVFKGKKMAGHMGQRNVTTQNLEIVAIYEDLNVIAIKGAIPGAKNSRVFIIDSVKKVK